jgi:putative addiction module component (TIGR02574 family)
MPRSLEEVRQLAYELPEDQRILLANALWESVASEEENANEAEVEGAWDSEIKRRLDEIDSGAVEMISGEQVRAEMVASLTPHARARLGV